MANHKSAIKRNRQNIKKRLRNKMKTSRARTFIKKLRVLIAEGKKDEATNSLPKLQSILGKLSKTNTMKQKTVSRKISRLSSQIQQMAG